MVAEGEDTVAADTAEDISVEEAGDMAVDGVEVGGGTTAGTVVDGGAMVVQGGGVDGVMAAGVGGTTGSLPR